MTQSQTMPIILNLFAALLGALGQYAYKKGGLQLTEVAIFKNVPLWSGVLLFCGVMVLFVLGYNLGGRISVVYPFYATTFIWGALIGHYIEKEPLNLYVIGGTLLIITGLVVIARGMNEVPS